MKLKRVMWLSQYPPVLSQVQELQRRYGDDMEINHVNISNAEDVAHYYTEERYDDLVAIVPLAVLYHLCRQGLKPLWPDVVQVQAGDTKPAEWFVKHRGFRFVGFRRVNHVQPVLEEVKPTVVYQLAWYSQHRPSPYQWSELRRLMSNRVQIQQYERYWKTAEQLADHYRNSGCDDLLVVGPYGLLERLCQLGFRPLFMEMSEGQFVAFKRLISIQLEFEE